MLLLDYFVPGKVYKFSVVKTKKYFKDNKDKSIQDLYFGHEKYRTGAASMVGKFTVIKKTPYVRIKDKNGFAWTIFAGECEEY